MEKTKKPPVEATAQKLPPGHHKQRRLLFKKRQAGVILSREQVKTIKTGRKKLRKELRARGIKSRKEFELTASSLGLYFDKNRFWGLLLWLFHGRGLWALLGALAALLLALFLFSLVSQLRGHFTINLADGLFREGFSLSETVDFENPSMRLFAEPAVDVPCISIMDLHDDVNEVDGQHNEAEYFAYTFYIRNEGETTVGFTWDMSINSESQNLSEAVWVMFFEDDEMTVFAKSRDDGTTEALPYFDDNTHGYLKRPLVEYARDPDALYQVIKEANSATYYRLVPESFTQDMEITNGVQNGVEPMEVHKYTVVIWLEGDDPDCTNELVGGHLGMEMNFHLLEEDEESNEKGGFSVWWDAFWDNLIFWED